MAPSKKHSTKKQALEFEEAAKAVIRAVQESQPIKERDIPEWFQKALLKAYGQHHPIFSYPKDILGPFRIEGIWWDWWDHWGSGFTDHGWPAFVSEPYRLTSGEIGQIVEMCRRTGLDFELDGCGWHYPGGTFRVLIFEPRANSRGEGRQDATHNGPSVLQEPFAGQ